MLLSYLGKRILVALPTLFGISVLCFALVQLTPGGPVEQTLAQWRMASAQGEASGGKDLGGITEEQRAQLVAYYGFDKPLHVRYLQWVGRLLRGDFGESYHYDRPVTDLLLECFPVSLSFGLFSFFLTYLVCVPLGVLKAVRNNSLFDSFTSALIFFLYSIPSFALAIVLIVLFCGGSFWRVFPIEGLTSENFSALSPLGKVFDYLHHLFLPLSCYLLGSFATLTVVVKNSTLEELSQDYILTARAKGLTERAVILRHAVRNALLPVANGLGEWLTLFFSGSVLIESVFSLRGVGRLSYESLLRRDYPVVLGIILILSALHIIGRLLSDLLYVVLDPRIDFK